MLCWELFEKAEITAEFSRWFGKSVAKDANGAPLVLYHGTAMDFAVFKTDMFWASESPKLASDYAEMRGFFNDGAHVRPVYLRIERPFNADVLPSAVTIENFFEALTAQSGKSYEDFQENIHNLRRLARWEESGPHYSAYDFWYQTRDYFGQKGAAILSAAYATCGFDGIVFTEKGALTYGVFRPDQVRSVFA